MGLFQNFSFWNSFLGFNGKTGILSGFSKSLFQNRARLARSQLVLEQAQMTIEVTILEEGNFYEKECTCSIEHGVCSLVCYL
jgi:hypothetical protein